jgi:hypothetical protein
MIDKYKVNEENQIISLETFTEPSLHNENVLEIGNIGPV